MFEADINMKNEDGNTPIFYACMRGNLPLVKLLNQRGAHKTIKNNAELTPLLMAIHYSHYFVVHFMLS